MNQKQLGKTGVKISEIGQGTWNYKGGVEPLRLGVSLGATHVDTAEIYGTEGVVGEAIEGIRDEVFLATKVWSDHLDYDGVLKAAEGSSVGWESSLLTCTWFIGRTRHFPYEKLCARWKIL